MSSQLRRWMRLLNRDEQEAESSLEANRLSAEVCPQGLLEVAPGVDPVVDIVAVHGLNGHQDKTWTAANGVHWPRDLLPNNIPQARIQGRSKLALLTHLSDCFAAQLPSL